MNYKNASVGDLIGVLFKQERHPDLKLIQEMLRRGDEIVPALIEVIKDDQSWATIHAGLLLCELGNESALPALQRAISAPWGQDLADWLCDDALEKFGPAALGMLEAIAADRAVDWYSRAVACRVMRNVAFRHRETYGRVTAFLRGLLPDPCLDWRAFPSYEAVKEAIDDPKIWTSVVGRLCDLRDPEAYDLIGQLFEAGLVDPMVMGAENYRQMYQKSNLPADFSPKPVSLMARYQDRSRPRDAQIQAKLAREIQKQRKKRQAGR